MAIYKDEMSNTSTTWLVNKVRLLIEALIRLVDGDKTFYKTDNISFISDFEKNYISIKKELIQLFKMNVEIPDWQSISNDPSVKVGEDWTVFVFKIYNNSILKNQMICPFTAALIEKYPQITTAWFSILQPHKKIVEHRGPYNGVLRYHLGLLIPSDSVNCGIRVKDDIRHWEEGKSILFDDTHLHEAWNNTDEVRVVLFMDIIRDLPFPVSILNRMIIRLIKYSGLPVTVANNLK